MTNTGEGFLSPERRAWRAHVNSTAEFKRWLELADCLLRIALDAYRRVNAPSSDAQLIAALAFARAIESFEAAVHALEGGFIGDARTIVRSAVESALALGAISLDETFVARLFDAAQLKRLQTARMIVKNPVMRAECSPEKIARIEASIAEIEEANRKLQEIKWGNVVRGTPFQALYDSLYRLFSNDGTHVTLEALNRHVTTDAAGNITGVRIGPTSVGWRDTMHGACAAMLGALPPTLEIFGLKELDDDLGNRLRPYLDLLQQDDPDPAA